MSSPTTPDSDFFKQTGYQKSFILETLNKLVNKEFDASGASEFIYTAFWDATTEVEVTKLLNEIDSSIYLPLMNNLFSKDLENNPRLFEITAGVIGNLLSDTRHTKFKEGRLLIGSRK